MVISERAIFTPPQETLTSQSYAQEMTNIWHRVNGIQKVEENSPQRNATNFDLWKLAETDTPITPDNYPSLARHGLLKPQQGENSVEWQTSFEHLRDFWEIGAEAGFTGYRVIPEGDFQKRLEDKIEAMLLAEEVV